jgi:hypothetical protein
LGEVKSGKGVGAGVGNWRWKRLGMVWRTVRESKENGVVNLVLKGEIV